MKNDLHANEKDIQAAMDAFLASNVPLTGRPIRTREQARNVAIEARMARKAREQVQDQQERATRHAQAISNKKH